MREEGLRTVARRELAHELLEKPEDALACGIVAVERMGYWTGQERSEQVVDALRVEERRQLREDFRRGDAQGDYRDGYGGSGDVRANDAGFGEDGEIRAVGREDDVVDGEEGHSTFGGCGDMAGVDSEHVGGHV